MSQTKQRQKILQKRLEIDEIPSFEEAKKTDVTLDELILREPEPKVSQKYRTGSVLNKFLRDIVDISNYDRIKRIGKGGSSNVYRTKNDKGEFVAEKKLNLIVGCDLEKSNKEEELFERQIEVMKYASEHEQMPTFFGIGLDKGDLLGEYKPSLLMELIEGDTLDKRFGEKVSTDYLRDVAFELTKPLEFLHEGGYLHRDIKPKNIIEDETGVFHLVDMGSARGREGMTVNGTVDFKGTFGYAHPQVEGGGKAEERTDLFSIGQVLRSLARGKDPSYDEAQMKSNEISWLKAKDEGLYNLIVNLCDYDLNKGPQSVKELQRYLEDDSVQELVDEKIDLTGEEDLDEIVSNIKFTDNPLIIDEKIEGLLFSYRKEMREYGGRVKRAFISDEDMRRYRANGKMNVTEKYIPLLKDALNSKNYESISYFKLAKLLNNNCEKLGIRNHFPNLEELSERYEKELETKVTTSSIESIVRSPKVSNIGPQENIVKKKFVCGVPVTYKYQDVRDSINERDYLYNFNEADQKTFSSSVFDQKIKLEFEKLDHLIEKYPELLEIYNRIKDVRKQIYNKEISNVRNWRDNVMFTASSAICGLMPPLVYAIIYDGDPSKLMNGLEIGGVIAGIGMLGVTYNAIRNYSKHKKEHKPSKELKKELVDLDAQFYAMIETPEEAKSGPNYSSRLGMDYLQEIDKKSWRKLSRKKAKVYFTKRYTTDIEELENKNTCTQIMSIKEQGKTEREVKIYQEISDSDEKLTLRIQSDKKNYVLKNKLDLDSVYSMKHEDINFAVDLMKQYAPIILHAYREMLPEWEQPKHTRSITMPS